MANYDKLFKKSKEIILQEKQEERKQKALNEGIEYTYVSCPLCAMNRILSKGGIVASKKGKIGRVSFSNFDFSGENGKFFIQIRKNAGGKGGGFWLDESKSLTWREAKKLPEYKEMFEEIKRQCEKILEEIK